MTRATKPDTQPCPRAASPPPPRCFALVRSHTCRCPPHPPLQTPPPFQHPESTTIGMFCFQLPLLSPPMKALPARPSFLDSLLTDIRARLPRSRPPSSTRGVLLGLPLLVLLSATLPPSSACSFTAATWSSAVSGASRPRGPTAFSIGFPHLCGCCPSSSASSSP